MAQSSENPIHPYDRKHADDPNTGYSFLAKDKETFWWICPECPGKKENQFLRAHGFKEWNTHSNTPNLYIYERTKRGESSFFCNPTQARVCHFCGFDRHRVEKQAQYWYSDYVNPREEDKAVGKLAFYCDGCAIAMNRATGINAGYAKQYHEGVKLPNREGRYWATRVEYSGAVNSLKCPLKNKNGKDECGRHYGQWEISEVKAN